MLDKQFKFTKALSLLIYFINSKGFEVTLGDAWALKGEGRLHSRKSSHYDRLAIDLNLFKDGDYLTETSDHEFAGKFWKSLGGTWGGDWEDGNHYSWGEGR